MAVDADTAEADVNAAQFLDQVGDVSHIVGIGEDTVVLGNIQFGLNLGVDSPVHETAEAQRMVHIDPLLVVIQVLVHVDEPAVVQIDVLFVDHVHEI